MAILEIEIGADEQAWLHQDAQRAGVSASEWARRRLFGTSPSDREAQLVKEYHALADSQRRGQLSNAENERLRQVEAELDELEAQNPQEQAMDQRLHETTSKLDEALELLRGLPKKP